MPYLILSCCVALAMLILRGMLGRIQTAPALEIGTAQTLGKQEIYADASDWARYDNQRMFVVANGIGRGRKGEIAAKEATETLVRLFEATGATDNPKYFFKCAFQAANAAILQRIVDGTAGASLLCGIVKDGHLYYALVGNCKICVFRGGDLIPLSEGQTVDVLAKKAFGQGQITRLDALTALKEKRLYSFIGHDGFRGIELFDIPITLKPKDIIVMMSDGVYDFSTTKQIEDILKLRGNATRAAERIVRRIEMTDHPEQDNATVLLAKVNRV